MKELITPPRQACSEAEDALTASLGRLCPILSEEPVLSGDAAYLAALDGVAANKDEEPT